MNINFHQHVLNYILQLVYNLAELISDDVVSPFMQSETMFNYNKLISIWYMTWDDTEEQLKKIHGRISKQETSMKRFQAMVG